MSHLSVTPKPEHCRESLPDRSADALVIGAGIAGLWTALHLAEAGIHTLVIQRKEGLRGELAGSTTRSVGAINLRPLRSNDFESELFDLGHGQENPTIAHSMTANLEAQLEKLKAFTDLEPIALGVRVGGCGMSEFLERLRVRLRELRVEFIDGTVTRLRANTQQCSGVEYATTTGSGRIFAPNVVMACGGFAGLYGRAPKALTQGSLLGQFMVCGGIIANPEFVFKHGFGVPDTSELTPTEALRGASIVDSDGGHVSWLERLVFDGEATSAHQRAVRFWRKNPSKDFFICYHHKELSEACTQFNRSLSSPAPSSDTAPGSRIQKILAHVPARHAVEWASHLLLLAEENTPIDYDNYSRLRALTEPVEDTSSRRRVRELPYFTMGGAAHRDFLTNLDGVFVNGEAMHDFGADRVGGLPWALYLSAAPVVARQVQQRLAQGVCAKSFDRTPLAPVAEVELLDRLRTKLALLQQDGASEQTAREGLRWTRAQRCLLPSGEESTDEARGWLLLAEAIFAASALRAESRGCFSREDHVNESPSLTRQYSLCRYSASADKIVCAFARRELMNSITPEYRKTMSMRPLTLNAVELLLERHLREGHGEAIALVEWQGEKYSYERLHQLTHRISQELIARNIHVGERVALLLPDSAHLVAAFLACLKIGCVAVPTNTFAKGEDLIFLLNDMNARLVFATEDLSGGLRASAKDEDFVLPPIVDPNFLSTEGFEALIETRPVAPNDPAFWLYTSGTTGHPKAAMHTHGGIESCAKSYPRDVLELKREDRCYSTSKMFFAYGLGNSIIFPLSCGATSIIDSERGTPQRIVRILEKLRPTKFFSIPTIYSRLVVLPELTPELLSSVDLCVSAGEYLPGPVEKAWRDATAQQVLDGIGTTESMHIFCSNHRNAQRSGTSGTVVSGYELQVVDDNGEQTAPGQVGHLRVRGGSLAIGYHARPEATAHCFQDGWLRTGDLFSVDEDGYFTYAGRSTDSFKSSGLWISPSEIEQALVSELSISEAAVIASEDDSGLIGPKAFITMHPDSIPALPQAELGEYLRNALRARLPNFKVPHSIRILAEMPRTATGKVDRAALRRPA